MPFFQDKMNCTGEKSGVNGNDIIPKKNFRETQGNAMPKGVMVDRLLVRPNKWVSKNSKTSLQPFGRVQGYILSSN